MASRSRLERFAEWIGGFWFAAAYIVATCFHALEAGKDKAAAENLPPNEESK